MTAPKALYSQAVMNTERASAFAAGRLEGIQEASQGPLDLARLDTANRAKFDRAIAEARAAGAASETARVIGILGLKDERFDDVTHTPPASLTDRLAVWVFDPKLTVEEARARFHESARAYDVAARQRGILDLQGDEASFTAPTSGYGGERSDAEALKSTIKMAADLAAAAKERATGQRIA